MKRLNNLGVFLLVFSGALSAFAQPANDNFASRTAIIWPGTNTTISGTLANTTFETGEPFLDGISSGQTAWWTWIASSNGIVTLSVGGTGFIPLFTVYSGNDLASLSLVASNNYLACYESTNCGCHWRERDQATFHVTRGQAYQVAVDSAIITDSSWVYEEVPDTEILPTGAIRIEIRPAGAIRILPRLPRNIQLLTIGETNVGVVGVYVPVHTTNILGGGEVQLGFQFTPAPINDDFENRTGLSGARLHLSASNFAADKQPGEPNHSGNPGGSSVWYSWKAPASGRVTFSTNDVPPYAPPSWYGDYSYGFSCSWAGLSGGLSPGRIYLFVAPTCGAEIDQTPPPPPFFPILAAYTGTNLNSLVSANSLPFSQDSYPHAIEFDAVKGQTYQLAFDGNLGTTGTIPLYLALTTPASNDNFKNRIKLHGIDVTATGFNAGATHETAEPVVSGSNGKSVWWSWIAPVSGTVSIDLAGSEHSFPVGVFTGTSISRLNLVGSGVGGVSFEAVRGRVYQIAVNDAAGLTSAIRMSVQASGVELPLVRRVSHSARLAVLSYAASPHQIVLFQSSNDGSTWNNVSIITARQTTVNFVARPAPTASVPFYRAIVVDYQ